MNKSFLKWAGSKRLSVDFIKEYIDNIEGRLIEPFVGSGVVSLNIEAPSYILSDCNIDLINLFKTIQIYGDAFIDFCENLFITIDNTEIQYYKFRTEFNSTKDIFYKSALFIYLNRHAFNGLCRYNSSGKFNVPYGKYKTVYFPRKELEFFNTKSKKCIFLVQDFKDTIKMSLVQDAIYCDPPYVPISTTSNFTSYYSKKFEDLQQKQLVNLAENSNCLFLISNSYNDYTMELYKNADLVVFNDVCRSINSKGDLRQKVKELLAIYNSK